MPGLYKLQSGKSMRFGVGVFSVGRFVFHGITYDSHALPPPGIWIPHAYPEFRNELTLAWPLIERGGKWGRYLDWPPPTSLSNDTLIRLRSKTSAIGTIWRS
jgi:hypothetical protein